MQRSSPEAWLLCSDSEPLNKGADTEIKRNQLVAKLANSFTEHDRGLLFRPKDGALVKVKHYPSVDTAGAFVLTKTDATGKTMKPPEHGYNVKPTRRAASMTTTAEYDDEAEYYSSSD